ANRAPYGCGFLSTRVLLSWSLLCLSMGPNTLFATDRAIRRHRYRPIGDRNTGSRLALVCVSMNPAMSAPIFTGSLWAVLPGRTAIVCNPGERCAVCETCKALVCNVLG